MANNLKALAIVATLALLMFALARPICIKYMSADAFRVRRNAWFALTVVAFVSPAFWLYALVATIILIVALKRDPNPFALFVMVTFTAPNARYSIPFPLVQQFFDLTQYRMLSLLILVPLLFKSASAATVIPRWRFTLIDVLMLGFIAIQIALQVAFESPTTTLRRSFLLFLDIYVFVVTFSRIGSKARIVEVMTSFWLSCIVMSPVAVFEWARGWLLYTGLNQTWGDPNVFAYLLRGDFLRAQAATGHSLNLGYVSTVGLGFFLYLRQGVSARMSLLYGMLSASAILVSGSRAALVAAVIAVIVFYGFRPNAARRLAGVLLSFGLVFMAVYISPLKESVLDRLPVIGTIDQGNIEYRKVLLEASWTLIKQNPLFGSPFAANQLEFLRQGQGIIDIVNGYVFYALFSGLVGLSFLVGSLVLALRSAFIRSLKARNQDADTALVGTSLVSVFLATLFYVGTAGFSETVFILIGMLVSYGSLRTVVSSEGGFLRFMRPVGGVKVNVDPAV